MIGNLKLPAIVTLIGSLLLGVLQVLNQTVLVADDRVHQYITIAIVFAGLLGLRALSGGLFRAALHLPQWANTLIAAILAGLALLVSTGGLDSALKGILVGIITVAGALGFGPAGGGLAGDTTLILDGTGAHTAAVPPAAAAPARRSHHRAAPK